ncbi:hypothetical protein MLD38_018026 [Melastoma candidum]|uniref:Uncharacterized protein n=1 Tax=Melastoma candidum TaxID=119954 RepID=A0ACB9QRN9_9MYRT|nr:hypothetical protein MLD38_018026 [Melastoma candidum]
MAVRGGDGGGGGCGVRALWILDNHDAVVFSRVFLVVEKRWRRACKSENELGGIDSFVSPYLPSDVELSSSFVQRKNREGSGRGFGIRVTESAVGSDSWVDDPITRHVISLNIQKAEEAENHFIWPFILHIKGQHCIIVLPFVEPKHVKAYKFLCQKSDCGDAVGADGNLSSLLLDLPSVTGAFMVAHAIGDIVSGDTIEPEVIVNVAPSVGNLLDSLTGSIGIAGMSSRAKPVAGPVSSSTISSAVVGTGSLDAAKTSSRLFDKEALRTFIGYAMPFGTPLDLSASNIYSIKSNGFSSSDLPPADTKQPAWKPYLYKGKQRILFTIFETINAAMYDRDEIPDNISVSGQINCRAELEGMPDVSLPLTGLSSDHIESLSFHHSAQVPEQGADKKSVMFSPPLGNFVLLRYQGSCNLGPPIKGFYQLSMVSEDEGAFLFRLNLMEGYRSPLTMEFCTVTMPFPRRRVISVDGSPSVGSISTTEHSVEWKIVVSGRGLNGKSLEATFPGTVKFAPWQGQKFSPANPSFGNMPEEESDVESEGGANMVNIEDYLMEKMGKDLPPVDLEEPFCWQAYDYAKVVFRISGASLSGISIDPKSVSIYPAVKAPAEFSTQVNSGDYILWNTLGRCPSAAVPPK